MDEALVTGDVDEAERAAVPLQMSEAEIDGDPPRLLLGEAIAVDPGQRVDETGLAVVDVTGGTYDEMGQGSGSGSSRTDRRPQLADKLAPR